MHELPRLLRRSSQFDLESVPLTPLPIRHKLLPKGVYTPEASNQNNNNKMSTYHLILVAGLVLTTFLIGRTSTRF